MQIMVDNLKNRELPPWWEHEIVRAESV